MGIYKRLFLVLFLLVILPSVSHAQVSKIVFTTEPQTIKPNELSGPLTIQTQDSSGSSYKTPETIYLEFVSTSSTGEFLGSTGNPVTKTMSTNTSNRTFYYRDSGLGTFTLTVNAKGRTSGAWNAGQIITVSESASATTSDATSTVPATSSGAISNTSVVIISTHYSAAPLTNTETDTKFEVGAGRDRLGTVGTPIEFRAESNQETTRQTVYKWNFGDGVVGDGEVVSHAYLYPGEYVVVLNVSGPDGQAVSRANVRIVPSELSVSFASPEKVEITNNSKNETNLFGRAIVSGSQIFVFPQDTIINAGQKVSFSGHVTRLAPFGSAGVSLVVVGTEVRPQEVMAKMEEQRLEKITSIRNEIAALEQRRMALLQRQTPNPEAVTENENRPLVTEIEDVEDGDTRQTALVLDSVSEAESGRMGNWLQTLKSFFFRTQ